MSNEVTKFKQGNLKLTEKISKLESKLEKQEINFNKKESSLINKLEKNETKLEKVSAQYEIKLLKLERRHDNNLLQIKELKEELLKKTPFNLNANIDDLE